MCVKSDIVKPSDHIVVVQKVHDSFMIKVSSSLSPCACQNPTLPEIQS